MTTPDRAIGRARGDAGFTLVELIAVLVIAALATNLAIASFNRPAGVEALRILAIQTAQLARAARADAIAAGDARLIIDLATRTIRTGSEPVLRIADDISVAVTAARSERPTASSSAIRFHPDGSSSGGTIRLSKGVVGYDVRINWFTGRVVVTTAQ